MILAQHPIFEYCKNNKKINNSTLLILVSGPMTHSRFFINKIQKWISAIQIVMKLKNPSQIHLRLHPRESKNIIMQFENALLLNNINYTILDSNKVSIVDNICDYMGVIGSPSTSLKVFRWATKDTFVLCLDDVTLPGFDGSFLSIGDSTGIKCIDENTFIDLEMLESPKNLSFQNLPLLKDCLNKIL